MTLPPSSLLLVLALAAAPTHPTPVREFVAPIAESTWEVEGNPLECRLSHGIVGLGRASFVRRAGGSLDFHLQADPAPPRGAVVQLRAEPAPWMHGAPARPLDPPAAREGAPPLHLAGERAGALLASLGEGYFPTFSYRADRAGIGSVRVALSAVRFQAAMEQFEACAQALLPSGFEEIRASSVHFDPGRTTLGARARARLDLVAAWLRLDHGVAAVVLTGHADSTGSRRANYLLSQRRALTVRDYLRDREVDPALIQVRFHGQEKPAASNQTDAGRHQNRRVDVRLVR